VQAWPSKCAEEEKEQQQQQHEHEDDEAQGGGGGGKWDDGPMNRTKLVLDGTSVYSYPMLNAREDRYNTMRLVDVDCAPI